MHFNNRNTNKRYAQQPYTQIDPFVFQERKRSKRVERGLRRGSSLYFG